MQCRLRDLLTRCRMCDIIAIRHIEKGKETVMGNFDMNSVFNENMKVSTYELAKELSNESNGKNEMADEI